MQGQSNLFLRKGPTSTNMILAVGSLTVAVGVVVAVVETLGVFIYIIMVVDCNTGPPMGEILLLCLVHRQSTL